jgi:hypothetical protein
MEYLSAAVSYRDVAPPLRARAIRPDDIVSNSMSHDISIPSTDLTIPLRRSGK